MLKWPSKVYLFLKSQTFTVKCCISINKSTSKVKNKLLGSSFLLNFFFGEGNLRRFFLLPSHAALAWIKRENPLQEAPGT